MFDKPISDIRVSDLLAEAKLMSPVTVGRDASLGEIADLISEKSYSRKVYVIEADGRLAGVITLEAMLKHAGYQLGVRESGLSSFMKMVKDLSKEKAFQIMAPPVKVSSEETIVNVAKLMIENHLNDLPVVDTKGRIVAELDGLELIRYVKFISHRNYHIKSNRVVSEDGKAAL